MTGVATFSVALANETATENLMADLALLIGPGSDSNAQASAFEGLRFAYWPHQPRRLADPVALALQAVRPAEAARPRQTNFAPMS